jgi:hypothetical protein
MEYIEHKRRNLHLTATIISLIQVCLTIASLTTEHSLFNVSRPAFFAFLFGTVANVVLLAAAQIKHMPTWFIEVYILIFLVSNVTADLLLSRNYTDN